MLIALGLPVLRALHESEHHVHDALRLAQVLSGMNASDEQARVEQDDDDCGACGICELMLVAAHQQTHLDEPLSLPDVDAPARAQPDPWIAQRLRPGTTWQPPARGPPSLV